MKFFLMALMLALLMDSAVGEAPAGNGDLNGDGTVLDIVDLVYAAQYMFQDGPSPAEFVGAGITYTEDHETMYISGDNTYHPVDSVEIAVPAAGVIRFEATLNTYDARAYLRWQPNNCPQYHCEWYMDSWGVTSFSEMVVADTAGTYSRRLEMRTLGPSSDIAIVDRILTATYFPAVYEE